MFFNLKLMHESKVLTPLSSFPPSTRMNSQIPLSENAKQDKFPMQACPMGTRLTERFDLLF